MRSVTERLALYHLILPFKFLPNNQILELPKLKAFTAMTSPPFQIFNKPLPNDKITDQSRLKTIGDSNLTVGQMVQSPFDRLENMVGKVENAAYQGH